MSILNLVHMAGTGALSLSAGAAMLISAEVAAPKLDRDYAYQLAENGRCDRAQPMFAALGEQSGQASDWLAASNCAIEIGDSHAALAALKQVLPVRYQLAHDQQVYALRSYAYQAEAVGDQQGAYTAWRDAYALSRSGEDRMMTARAARILGHDGDARDMLDQIEPAALSGTQAGVLFEERAIQAAKAGRSRQAVDLIAQAIAAEDTPSRRYLHGAYLLEAGMTRSAVSALERAARAMPDNANVMLSLAYAYREQGDDRKARDCFQRAADLNPAISRFASDFSA